MSDINNWINPQSTVTVAMAAGCVIGFTTTLCNSFPLAPAYVALTLSGLFALLQSVSAPPPSKKCLTPIYFVISALLIFHAARGGNITMSNMEESIRTNPGPISAILGMNTAYAQDVNTNKVADVINIGTNKFLRVPAINTNVVKVVKRNGKITAKSGKQEFVKIGKTWYIKLPPDTIFKLPDEDCVYEEVMSEQDTSPMMEFQRRPSPKQSQRPQKQLFRKW